MISLEPAEEDEAVADLARGIGLQLLDPAARTAEQVQSVPAAVWAQLVGSGLTHQLPEAFGGGGVLSVPTHMVAVENLAYGDPGITMAAVWAGAPALVAALHGDSDQVAKARAGCSLAQYEGFGRTLAETLTTIESLQDGSVRIQGRKVAVPLPEGTEQVLVIGVEKDSGSLVATIVPLTAGVSTSIPGRHIALDAVPIVDMTFDAVVRAGVVMGVADTVMSADALVASLLRFRLAVAAALIGTARRAVEYAAHYAIERVAFGRPIASFQGVSFPLAEAHMRLAAARLEVAEAATLVEIADLRAGTAVHHAVGYAGEVGLESTRNAVQALGGHGFITDHPVELWYRSAAALACIDFDPLCSTFEPAL